MFAELVKKDREEPHGCTMVGRLSQKAGAAAVVVIGEEEKREREQKSVSLGGTLQRLKTTSDSEKELEQETLNQEMIVSVVVGRRASTVFLG